jgi:hypothetical protein
LSVSQEFRSSGFRIQDSGFRIQDSGFRIQDSGRFGVEEDDLESQSRTILSFSAIPFCNS